MPLVYQLGPSENESDDDRFGTGAWVYEPDEIPEPAAPPPPATMDEEEYYDDFGDDSEDGTVLTEPAGNLYQAWDGDTLLGYYNEGDQIPAGAEIWDGDIFVGIAGGQTGDSEPVFQMGTLDVSADGDGPVYDSTTNSWTYPNQSTWNAYSGQLTNTDIADQLALNGEMQDRYDENGDHYTTAMNHDGEVIAVYDDGSTYNIATGVTVLANGQAYDQDNNFLGYPKEQSYPADPISNAADGFPPASTRTPQDIAAAAKKNGQASQAAAISGAGSGISLGGGQGGTSGGGQTGNTNQGQAAGNQAAINAAPKGTRVTVATGANKGEYITNGNGTVTGLSGVNAGRTLPTSAITTTAAGSGLSGALDGFSSLLGVASNVATLARGGSVNPTTRNVLAPVNGARGLGTGYPVAVGAGNKSTMPGARGYSPSVGGNASVIRPGTMPTAGQVLSSISPTTWALLTGALIVGVVVIKRSR